MEVENGDGDRVEEGRGEDVDGESEVPHPELAGTGGGQGIQPPVSGLRKERWVEKGGHGWGWFSAGMILRGKCRKNCLPRVSET